MKKLLMEYFADLVPDSIRGASGHLFYSGRNAFERESRLYVLGLNPGGCPRKQANRTVGGAIESVLGMRQRDWSAYRDESWRGKPAGTHGLQPRILHLFRELGLNPGNVPSSNLIFVRSTQAADLNHHFSELADLCWSFHETVIKTLGVNTVLCFGRRCGKQVRRRLDAHIFVEEFLEKNDRGWKSCWHTSEDGKFSVLTLTHPSRAAWQNPETDPTPLVRKALESHVMK